MADEQPKDRPGARRWMSIGISTVALFFSYLLFIYGFGVATGEERVFAGGVIGIASGLVPVVFGCLAAISQHERVIATALLASLLWVVVGLPIAILDIPTGLVAGFGVGGVVALRRQPVHTITSRMAVVAMCTVYVLVLGRIVPEAALMVGAVLPFAAVGVADSFTEREAAAAGRAAAGDEPV